MTRAGPTDRTGQWRRDHQVHIDKIAADPALPDAAESHLHVWAGAGADVAQVTEAADVALGVADITAGALGTELWVRENGRWGWAEGRNGGGLSSNGNRVPVTL